MSSVKLSLLSLTVGNNFDMFWRGYQALRARRRWRLCERGSCECARKS